MHERPRRYRHACWLGRDAWLDRVVHESDAILAVNKPHGLPSMAHESNAVEHCGGCVERSLGLPPGSLRVTHRLDSSTSGVLVLGKTATAVREFNDSVAKTPGSKEIVKSYAALVYAKHAVPLGLMTHWMYPGPFGPEALGGAGFKRSQARFLRAADVDGEFLVVNGEERKTTWKKCVLRVLSCEPADEETARRWHETHEAAVRASHKAPPARWLRRKPPASFDAGAKDSFRVKRNGRSGPSKTCIWRVRVELVRPRVGRHVHKEIEETLQHVLRAHRGRLHALAAHQHLERHLPRVQPAVHCPVEVARPAPPPVAPRLRRGRVL